MKIERLGKHVHLTFRTEVQAVHFERQLFKVLQQKAEAKKQFEKQHATELQEARKQQKKGLWAQKR